MRQLKNTEKETTSVSEKQSNGLTLRDFAQNLKSVWWIVLTLTAACALLAYVFFAVTFVPLYRSTARFTITPLIDSNSASGASVYAFNYNETLSKQMAATFPHIVEGGFLTEIVENDLQRPLNGTISASAVEDTNLFELHVTSSSAQDAYDILNSLINNYPKIAEYILGDTQMNIIRGSKPVLSEKPFNAGSGTTYVLFGAFIGLGIGLLLVVVRMYTRKPMLSKRDIEVTFNGKCICEIPEVSSKRNSNKKALVKGSSGLSGFSESIRVLKQRVRLKASKSNVKVIGITSSVMGEGKTTISYNLAKSLSTSGKKTILVDVDFANRALQNILNRKNEVENVGITEIISGKIKIEESINVIKDDFDVLFAGSEQIKFLKKNYVSIFNYLREHYDYIIIDMPACDSAETALLADFCDGVLFAVKWNSTDRSKINNAINYLAFSDTEIIGYVLNKVNINHGGYGGYKYHGKYGTRRYGYGYSYGYGYGYGSYGYGYGSYGYGYGAKPEDIRREAKESKPLE